MRKRTFFYLQPSKKFMLLLLELVRFGRYIRDIFETSHEENILLTKITAKIFHIKVTI